MLMPVPVPVWAGCAEYPCSWPCSCCAGARPAVPTRPGELPLETAGDPGARKEAGAS